MSKRKRWMAAAIALALVLLCGGAALAAAGGKEDPLVTLSYLEQTVLPDILKQVDDSTAARQSELEKNLAAQIDENRRQTEQG